MTKATHIYHPACALASFISTAPASITEGDSGTKNMVFQVQLSAVSDLPVSLDYEAIAFPEGGKYVSARKGEDFNPTKGTLVIPAGSQTGTIIVAIKGDKEPESTEIFQMRITNVVNATATGSSLGIIYDND